MAEVYLKHEGNQSKYVACYTELANKLPGPPTFQLLGDAYMNVQEVSSCTVLCVSLFEMSTCTVHVVVWWNMTL